MTLSAAEQYLLELINRARLDPSGEAARLGIDLNQGLSSGQISTASKQVLAPNALLESAATKHTLWMIQNDIFSHTGANNSRPDQRVTAEGYIWNRTGENLVYRGSTGAFSVEGAIESLNQDLFLSPAHRSNMLNGVYREVGLGAESGVFTQEGTNFNVAMLTENFGTSGTAHFLTGVAYNDTNGDQFYSMGEATGGVVFRSLGQAATTAAAGGYSLALASDVATAVTGNVAGKSFSLTVDMAPGNVKLDIVGGTTFHASGSIVLGTGINKVVLLGVADLDASGNKLANALTGNAGGNELAGWLGADVLTGNVGDDVLRGGFGKDKLYGGAGADQLSGDGSNDVLSGGSEADVFIFAKDGGSDTITDFSRASGDGLQLDHNLWAGSTLRPADVIAQFGSRVAGGVLLDFGDGQQIHLTGLLTLSGLAAYIDIF